MFQENTFQLILKPYWFNVIIIPKNNVSKGLIQREGEV